MLIIEPRHLVILSVHRKGGEAVNVRQESDWLTDLLQVHLSPDELQQANTFLHAETWASPSALQRNWCDQREDLPLRFHLEIDMKV